MLEHMQVMDRAIYKLRAAYERLQPAERTEFADKLLRIAKIHLAEDIKNGRFVEAHHASGHDPAIFINFWFNPDRQEEATSLVASIKTTSGVDLLELKRKGVKIRPSYDSPRVDEERELLRTSDLEKHVFDMVAPGVNVSFGLKDLPFGPIPFLRKPCQSYSLELPVEQAPLAQKLAKKYPSHVKHYSSETDAFAGSTLLFIRGRILEDKRFRSFFEKLKLTPFQHPNI